MVNRRLDSYAAEWGVDVASPLSIENLSPLIEKISKYYEGYFIFKIDSLRDDFVYSFVFSLPKIQISIRRDTNSLLDGVEYFVGELLNRVPGPSIE